MKRNYRLYTAVLGTAIALSSCNDFLDKMPDSRTEVDNEKKITAILVSAYSETYPIMSYELASDNTMDNGANYDPFWKSITQAYRWEDVNEVADDDPKGIWEGCYTAIASANIALQAIEELGSPVNLNPQKGEALICRAYWHFVLANTFCMPYNPQTAESDMGIPYTLVPETHPMDLPSRGTMAELYALIDKDIQEALPLIDDDIYTIPKYHFNRKAAYAFATRFYLYYTRPDKSNYDKAIDCANIVLGTGDPTGLLRDWASLNRLPSDLEYIGDTYISASDPANLLLSPILSVWGYAHGPYSGRNRRYGNSNTLFAREGPQAAGPWGTYSNLRTVGKLFGLTQKSFVPKMNAYFEYSDKAAGIGSLHLVVPMFTTDETLLCRAEAYILKGDLDAGVRDINYWLRTHTVTYRESDRASLVNFYSNIAYMPTVPETMNQRTIKKRLNPVGFEVADGDQENLIQCVLHLRRVETVHEGLRWLDIKRYGIEISHNRDGETPDILTKDDLRRAWQLPQDVIAAGVPSNPRK